MTTAASPARRRWPPPLWLHGAAVALALAAAYVPDIGRGFVKDDFWWILHSRSSSFEDLARPFLSTTGFYRPFVSLSFAANEYIGGMNPLGYGLTNLALAILTAVGIAYVARAWQLRPAACLFAAAVWLMNFHGINMALLWISGRTALLVTLFSVFATLAVSHGRNVLATVLVLAAMFSKEEAVLLPAVLLFVLVVRGAPRSQIASCAAGFAAAEIVYFALRTHAGAVTPQTAAPFYQFTFDWSHVGKNIVEYVDRACTFTAGCLLVLVALAGRVTPPNRYERQIIVIGIAWLAVGYAITVFLPVRSSLYSCLPAVGVVWAGAAAATAIWRGASPRRQNIAVVVALILPLVLVPVYRARNVRWVELAELTTSAMPGLEAAVRESSDGNVVVIDDRSTRANLATSFDSHIAAAVAILRGGHRGSVWLVPPPEGAAAEETMPVPDRLKSAWVLENGRLVRRDSSPWIGAPAAVFH